MIVEVALVIIVAVDNRLSTNTNDRKKTNMRRRMRKMRGIGITTLMTLGAGYAPPPRGNVQKKMSQTVVIGKVIQKETEKRLS